ncbi:MAG: Ig-like domain-containing protein [Gemmatimonadaceae bacterium]|nr:Ig-like domain-containing protein [Gemmatimonadaceae bacterium]
MTIRTNAARFAFALLLTTALSCSLDSGDSTGVAPAVQSVSVLPRTAQVVVGLSVTLGATVTAIGDASTGVNWTTSNSALATVSSGTVLGKAPGTVTITATSQFDATKASSATVTVNAAPTPAIR